MKAKRWLPPIGIILGCYAISYAVTWRVWHDNDPLLLISHLMMVFVPLVLGAAGVAGIVQYRSERRQRPATRPARTYLTAPQPWVSFPAVPAWGRHLGNLVLAFLVGGGLTVAIIGTMTWPMVSGGVSAEHAMAGGIIGYGLLACVGGFAAVALTINSAAWDRWRPVAQAEYDRRADEAKAHRWTLLGISQQPDSSWQADIIRDNEGIKRLTIPAGDIEFRAGTQAEVGFDNPRPRLPGRMYEGGSLLYQGPVLIFGPEGADLPPLRDNYFGSHV